MIDDRQVVGRKIPDDIDIVLDDAKIDPNGVDEQELAQRAAVYELGELSDGRAVEEHVIDEQNSPTLVRGRDELACLLAAAGDRLLDEDMLPGQQRSHSELVV